MNTRQGILVTLTSATVFMNFAATYWTMWAVASISFGTLLITDLMFFDVSRRPIGPFVRAPLLRLPVRRRLRHSSRRHSCPLLAFTRAG